MKDLWIVGQYKSDGPNDYICWDFQGIFDSEEKAKKACKDKNYFVMGKFKMNEELEKETIEPDICYYPINGGNL